MTDDPDRATVTVETPDGDRHVLTVPPGTVLRDALLAAGLSPHGRYARRVNCGGRGLCATCGVRLAEPPDPEHWHDDLADRFGYPRLSCQIDARDGTTVRIPDKRVWGGREPDGGDEDASPREPGEGASGRGGRDGT